MSTSEMVILLILLATFSLPILSILFVLSSFFYNFVRNRYQVWIH